MRTPRWYDLIKAGCAGANSKSTTWLIPSLGPKPSESSTCNAPHTSLLTFTQMQTVCTKLAKLRTKAKTQGSVSWKNSKDKMATTTTKKTRYLSSQCARK